MFEVLKGSSNGEYEFDKDGRLTGSNVFINIEDQAYFIVNNEIIVNDTRVINNRTYKFDKDGAMISSSIEEPVVQNNKAGTKVSELATEIEGGIYEVRNKKGELLESDDIIGTGTEISLIVGGKVVATYTVSVLGDIDGDGKVLPSDARLVLRYCAKLEALDDTQLLAANADGSVGVKPSDARIILRVAAKLQTF